MLPWLTGACLAVTSPACGVAPTHPVRPDAGTPDTTCVGALPPVDRTTLTSVDLAADAISRDLCAFALRCPSFAGAFEGYCDPRFIRLERAELLRAATLEQARACETTLRTLGSCLSTLIHAGECLRVAHPEPAPGEACSPPGCGSGTCVQCRCERAPARGEPCERAPCAWGLLCAGGICSAAGGLGDPCPCGEGLHCAGDSCRRNAALACETCGPDLACDEGLACDPGSHRCAPLQPLGGGCELGDDCAPGERCVESVCTAFGPLGSACASDVECPMPLTRCVEGTCIQAPVVGDPCVITGPPCATGVCDGDACRVLRRGEGRCLSERDCDAALTCDDGECMPPPSSPCGAPCPENEACDARGAVPACSGQRLEVGAYCGDFPSCVDGARCVFGPFFAPRRCVSCAEL